MKHKDIKIYGRVQGVFFRAFAKEEAEKLGLRGYAKNLDDGSVVIGIEGTESDLQKFIVWCHEGPLLSNVEQVEISDGKLENYADFKIN